MMWKDKRPEEEDLFALWFSCVKDNVSHILKWNLAFDVSCLAMSGSNTKHSGTHNPRLSHSRIFKVSHIISTVHPQTTTHRAHLCFRSISQVIIGLDPTDVPFHENGKFTWVWPSEEQLEFSTPIRWDQSSLSKPPGKGQCKTDALKTRWDRWTAWKQGIGWHR